MMRNSEKECPNLGWLYYKDYYNGLTLKDIKKEKKEDEAATEKFFSNKNKKLVESAYHLRDIELKPAENTEVFPGYFYKSFVFETTYPGLTSGTGLIHETGMKGELKLGFQFDYTTGLPYLPGSSVKGLLRSMFPDSSTEKDPAKRKRYQEEREQYLQNALLEIFSDNKTSESKKRQVSDRITNLPLAQLEKSIFCNGDVFLDAFIEQTGKDGLLGFDYITPHKNAFKNPTPVQFIKIMPGVMFRFNFLLRDEPLWGLSTDHKSNLFRTILSDIGIGAKTNVGYGQLKKSCENR